MRALIEVIHNDDKVIALVDCCSIDNPSVTVTNDAEAVIRHLILFHGLKKQRVVYKDTDCVWDELRHDSQRFVGYKALRAMNLDEALKKCKEPVRARKW